MRTDAEKSIFGALRFFSGVTLVWDRIPELIVYAREPLKLPSALGSAVKTLTI